VVESGTTAVERDVNTEMAWWLLNSKHLWELRWSMVYKICLFGCVERCDAGGSLIDQCLESKVLLNGQPIYNKDS
jgi:hypothetical protein